MCWMVLKTDKTSASHQKHLSPVYIHVCTWKNVYQLGCRAPTPTSWCILVSTLLLDFGYPPNLPHPILPSPLL